VGIPAAALRTQAEAILAADRRTRAGALPVEAHPAVAAATTAVVIAAVAAAAEAAAPTAEVVVAVVAVVATVEAAVEAEATTKVESPLNAS
jgi:hypothetical protein